MINMIRKARAGLLLSGFAGLVLVAGPGSVLAQTCTITNWQVNDNPASVGLTEANVGTPAQSFEATGNFRRYGGPCALRVPVDGQPRYVRDGSPSDEASYNARFYVFLDSAGDQNIRVFEALDSSDNEVLSVWYLPAGGPSLALSVETTGGTETLTITNIEDGWQSVEFAWNSGPAATISFAVNVEIDSADPSDFITETLNTSGRSISEVRLGNIGGVSASGAYVDFDDHDSRRSTTPGRLCRGLTVESEAERNALSGDDGIEIFREAFGLALAAGQPDYDEDGVVSAADALGVYQTVFGIAGGAPSTACDDNR